MVTERIANALRLTAVDAWAAKLGLYPGMALTDARARVETLAVVEAAPQHDDALLNRLAHWCERYTPLVALDPPHGLMLDVTGCAHLFGGLEALRGDALSRIARAVCPPATASASVAAEIWWSTSHGG